MHTQFKHLKNSISNLFIFQKGDDTDEILHLINEENCVTNSKLNYFQLCASLLFSKAAFNRLSLENGRVRDTNIPINTRTYTRKKSNYIIFLLLMLYK